MNISVFGSSKPLPHEPLYLEAYRLGSMLGAACHTVLTGGYCGTMEAVSRGANEAGAHVIGVTCDEIESWRPSGANEWVKEEWRTSTLTERIMKMVRHCDAAIALPGGVGTLCEIMVLWNHLAINALPYRPLVLFGSGWAHLMQTFYEDQGLLVPMRDRERLHFANSPEESIAFLSADYPN